ncbi:N-terminal acetyltransferase, partial [Ascosphaera pollenicola]
MTDPSHPAYRPTLTDSQLAAYLCRINNNAGSQGSSLLQSTKSQVAVSPLLALRELQAAHLRTIPFDNLGIHYNREHRLSLEPDALVDKLVTRKRGGYCMESTGLFGMVLRTLGYELYTGGTRVNEFFGEQGRERWEDGFWEG